MNIVNVLFWRHFEIHGVILLSKKVQINAYHQVIPFTVIFIQLTSANLFIINLFKYIWMANTNKCLTQPQQGWRYIRQCSPRWSVLWFNPPDSSTVKSGVNVIPTQHFRLRNNLLFRGRSIKHFHDFSCKYRWAAQHLHSLISRDHYIYDQLTKSTYISPFLEVFILHLTFFFLWVSVMQRPK